MPLIYLVGGARFELATNGLKVMWPTDQSRLGTTNLIQKVLAASMFRSYHLVIRAQSWLFKATP